MQDQPVPNNPDAQFARWQQVVEERLRALETAPRISSTSQRGGSYTLLDDDGRVVWTFGEYTRGPVTDYGVQAIAPDGNPAGNATAIEVNADGLEAPWIPMHVTQPNNFVVITAGAFTNAWQAAAPLLVSNAIEWFSVVGCDPGTTAEARLNIGSGTKLSGVIACAAGAFTNLIWSLLHDQDLGANLFLDLEVRRTAGAGNVNVYFPLIASQAGGAGSFATSDGL